MNPKDVAEQEAEIHSVGQNESSSERQASGNGEYIHFMSQVCV